MADKLAPGESWKTGSALKRQRMEVYLNWLLTPPSQRVPQLKKELAASMDVQPETLWRYEQERWFQDELMSRRRGLFKVIDVEGVLKTLLTIAIDPGNRQAVSAARTLLEWSEKAIPGGQGIDLSGLTNEELIALIKELDARDERDTSADQPRADDAPVQD